MIHFELHVSVKAKRAGRGFRNTGVGAIQQDHRRIEAHQQMTERYGAINKAQCSVGAAVFDDQRAGVSVAIQLRPRKPKLHRPILQLLEQTLHLWRFGPVPA